MLASEKCPPESELAAFVRGQVTASQRRLLEQHLDGCRTCRRAAVEMLTYAGGGPPPSPTAPRATADDLQPGDKVGRHLVVGRIGAGGMGMVYAAYDTTLERKIALKFLSTGAEEDREGERLLKEASAMAQLSHPNVVTAHDAGIWEGRPYLAMEYVKGQTLDEWRRKPDGSERPAREILRVMASVAHGLEAAHAAGIVHRDVKPQNVLVADGRVLVTDFGVSVRDRQAGEPTSAAGTRLRLLRNPLRDVVRRASFRKCGRRRRHGSARAGACRRGAITPARPGRSRARSATDAGRPGR
jgi:eukaryotic-like serine/threonine-protein kinase